MGALPWLSREGSHPDCIQWIWEGVMDVTLGWARGLGE